MSGRLCVILGTSHEIQGDRMGMPGRLRPLSDGLARLISRVIDQQRVALVAEENPFSLATRAAEVARGKSCAYIPIDVPHGGRKSPTQGEEAGAPRLEGSIEYRFCLTDEIRENSWLDEIERAGASSVLVVCGYCHAYAEFLPTKASQRGWTVAGPIFHPQELAGRESDHVCRPPFARRCGSGCPRAGH